MLDPDTVRSGRSKRLFVDGQELRIEIYRLVNEGLWSLELVDENGAATVWTRRFETEQAAMDEALKAIEKNFDAAAPKGAVVIPFPKK
ncbi:MAG: hypothetical protein OXT06_17670 [Rhodospirillaceae bacterium]|nr:hypothetical protein [Rhodospirillaceae bacterium]MDD9914296.1 hypothetical protein [Rhodospirillaceae bacterium]MDD9926069.1 hypothetical protein [Rhodospirillaceae bacterium]